jgi:hypothetical protein
MTDKVIRIKIESGDSKAQIDSLDKSMVGLGSTVDKTNAEINELNTDLTKTAQGVKVAVGASTEAIGNFGRSAGQAGVQIQQLVGQVQGGVSPFVALSQQAADLGFVLGFPLLGAVVGIGAALAGPLVAAFTQAEESADKFKETLKGIVDTQEELKVNKAVAEINALNREFDKQQETITNLTRQQAQYIELIKQGGSAQASYAAALFQIDGQLDSAREKQQELAKKIEEVTNASLSNKATAAEQDDTLQRLNSTLEVQRIALEQGELQARLYAAAQALTLDTANELPPAIREQITAIYELEQAQKAAKESAAELNREINSQAETDRQQAARAAREQERIDQRIANMQLETRTLASESELRRAVIQGAFSQEEADLAFQTSSRILAASTEYQQLMELDNINKEQKLQAEIAFQEQIAAINQQYDEAKLQMKQRIWMQELSAQQSAANAGIQLIAAFGSQSFQAQKNASIATSLVNIAGGVAKALNNPFPLNLGFAAQVASHGAALISTIKSTNIGSGGSLSSLSSSAPTLPTTPQSAAQVGSFEITGLAGLQEQLDRLDNDEVLPVSFTKRLVASLESVQRLQGA